LKKLLVTVSILFALAACGGGSFAPSPAPTPSPANALCVVFDPPTLALASPASGAVDVPYTNVRLDFSGALGEPGDDPTLNVLDAAGFGDHTNVFKAAGSNNYTVTIPQLAQATTYTVTLQFETGENAPCNQLTLTLGSFTTQ
jgi:hypothetical protein